MNTAIDVAVVVKVADEIGNSVGGVTCGVSVGALVNGVNGSIVIDCSPCLVGVEITVGVGLASVSGLARTAMTIETETPSKPITSLISKPPRSQRCRTTRIANTTDRAKKMITITQRIIAPLTARNEHIANYTQDWFTLYMRHMVYL